MHSEMRVRCPGLEAMSYGDQTVGFPGKQVKGARASRNGLGEEGTRGGLLLPYRRPIPEVMELEREGRKCHRRRKLQKETIRKKGTENKLRLEAEPRNKTVY